MENNNAARKNNEEFARRVVDAAMEVIRQRVAREKQQGDLNCEVFYAIQNPFEAGTEEHQYIEAMLSSGSGMDPNYIDLFNQLRTGLKDALDAECVHSFLMLNCRFDPQCEDNFLLYVLVGWGG